MIETRIESKAIAKVSRRPELARTSSGFPVCRFTVATDEGCAKNPVIMPVYAFGGPSEGQRRLALRCAKLRVGELVQVAGVQRQRMRQTKESKLWRENSLEALDLQVLGPDGRPLKQSSEESERPLKGLVVHCERSPYEVYIGRGKCPVTEQPGEWGNRYSHRPSKVEDVIYVATAEEAVALYKIELWERINSGALPLERLAALAGKTLGCWCTTCCHGHVLASGSIWAWEELRRRGATC